MRIPVLGGRAFTATHDVSGAPVVVINRGTGAAVTSGRRRSDRTVASTSAARQTNPWMTIVGVVGNVAGRVGSRAPRPMIYRPLTQASNLSMGMSCVAHDLVASRTG